MKKEELIELIKIGEEYFSNKIAAMLTCKTLSLTGEKFLKDLKEDIFLSLESICERINEIEGE